MCVDSCMRAYGREGESKDRGGAGGRGWDTAPRTCGSAPRAGAEVASWEAGGSPWPQELCPYPSWATPGSDGSPGEWDDTWGSGWDSWQRGGIRLLERRRPCASGFTLDTEECPSESSLCPSWEATSSAGPAVMWGHRFTDQREWPTVHQHRHQKDSACHKKDSSPALFVGDEGSRIQDHFKWTALHIKLTVSLTFPLT